MDWVLGWYNLIYLLPLGTALLYLITYAATGVTFGDADVDMDADVDVDADIDMDVDADLDVDVDVDADVPVAAGHGDLLGDVHGGHAAHDVDSDAQVSKSLASTLLSLFGVGHVPLSILLMVLFFSFGGIGYVLNDLLADAMGVPWMMLVSLPVAIVGSLGLTIVLGTLLAKYMPMNETSAKRRSALVGRRGIAVFDITTDAGVATVTDDGERYQVTARSTGDT
ncbi:MAG: hypothetical protein AAGK78_06975, partial [Planctomycetota bacterium]